ncbi:MAG: hypothetical protein AAFY11_02005, partial [Cyanobacteria bacterium J06641_5]
GIFAAVTSGVAFEAGLKRTAATWRKGRRDQSLEDMLGTDVIIPYLGICAGACIFLAASLEIFSAARWQAFLVSAPVVALSGRLVWVQMGKLMLEIQKGGSAAVDLDL